MSAENAWRIAREEAAVWHDAQADEYDAQYESKRGRAMPIIINASAHRSSARTLRSLPMPPAFRAAVEAEARAFAQREHPYADLHVEALAEIKATIDGKSDQPVAAIIEGVLEEIKARSDRLSRPEAKGDSHE